MLTDLNEYMDSKNRSQINVLVYQLLYQIRRRKSFPNEDVFSIFSRSVQSVITSLGHFGPNQSPVN